MISKSSFLAIRQYFVPGQGPESALSRSAAATVTKQRRRRLSFRRGTAVVIGAALLSTGFIGSPASAAPTAFAGSVPRASSCPSATVSVSTASQLQSALTKAKAGTVIKLAAGKYVGEFKMKASGSASKPIWLCGPRTAVLTTGSYKSGHALMINNVSNFVVAGFTINTAFKGVTVISSSKVSITDLSITSIGYEAVHLRNQTVDSVVSYNTITKTGLVTAKYGEGIYIGTSNANWCSLNSCNPDRTDRTVLRGNNISNTGAQPIEVKEGTSGGTIDGNTVTGSSRIEAAAKSLILVKGNNYSVNSNIAKAPRAYGLQTIASDGGWGRGNYFASNTIISAPANGIWIHQPSGQSPVGNVVFCSNKSSGTTLSNISCRS